MQNTGCCQCSSEPSNRRTRQISVLGKKLIVKDYCCSADGIHYKPKTENPKLQLSICPTTFCGGNCPFCVAAERNHHKKDEACFIDTGKLEQVLLSLERENIVRGVSVTGGEPFTDVGLLNEIVNMVFCILGNSIEVNINTNGTGLRSLHKIEKLSYVDALHISRHHYDDKRNREIFGMDVPDREELTEVVKSISYKDIFVLNCLLLKDYIGNAGEMHRYMDFAIETGVPKVSFITPMPVNPWAREQQVCYNDILSEQDKCLLFTRKFYDYEYCRCQDGVYASENGDIIEFYGRETKAGCGDYVRGLVYDAGNNLRKGFGGEIIR